MEKKIDYSQYSPVTLAYIGDAVFSLFIRESQIEKGDKKTGRLQREAIDYVSAKAQASIVDSILNFLEEDEKYIYKRGRNANSQTVPKNANPGDYRKSTGFEAVLGYLYLLKKEDRLKKVLREAYNIIISKDA
jgi:ribonuclease-3 family protein